MYKHWLFVCQRRMRAQPQGRARVTRMARFSEEESQRIRGETLYFTYHQKIYYIYGQMLNIIILRYNLSFKTRIPRVVLLEMFPEFR